MKRIGIVAEGPRDYEMLASVIDHITGTKNEYQMIQPENDLSGSTGNGWKGVWRWCEANSSHLNEYISSIVPKLDLLVIHMDGDVARKEQEVHCECQREQCSQDLSVHPLSCELCRQGHCPVILPCGKHNTSPDGFAQHLEKFISAKLGGIDSKPVVITIPCDSTDAWIVAAYEDDAFFVESQPERIDSPWEKVISVKKYYHDIRCPGKNKTKRIYDSFLPRVCANWNTVTQRCPQAKRFQQRIKALCES